MAQLAIAAAGAAIGGATLGTGIVAFGLTGTAIGWAAGSMLGSLLQKGPNSQGPRLNDLRVTGTEYGQAHPWAAGSPRLPGQIVWASNKREIRNSQKVGKGGGGQRVTTFTYEVDLLYRLTENEIAGVSRIWSNGELVYNGATTKAGVWNEVRIYTGASDQMPDPTYEAAVGAGNAPAYRGGGTVLIRGLQLGQSGQIPNLTFEVGISFGTSLRRLVKFKGSTRFFDGPHPANTSSWLQKFYISDELSSSDWQLWVTGATGSFPPLEQNKNPSNVIGGELYIQEYALNSSFSHAYLRADPSNDFAFDGDFTIGFKYKRTAENNPTWQSSSTPILLSCVPDFASLGPGAWTIRKSTGNGIQFLFRNQLNQTTVLSVNDPFPLLDRFYDLKIQRIGDTVRCLIDGVLVAQSTSSGWTGSTSNSYFVTLGTAGAGDHFIPNDYMGGFYDDLFFAEGAVNEVILTLDSVDASIDALMKRAGYSEDDYAVEDFSSEKPLRAFAIGQIGSTRSSLEVLQKAWYFEASKSDKIYIRPRAVTPVATITWADLGTSEDFETDQEPLALQIGSDLELPAQIALSYNNMAADYNVATENSDRLITNQLSTATVQMPLGMLPDEAKGVANALLFDQLASLTTTTIRVPLKYAYIEPGDVVNAVNFDGRTYRIRVIAKRDTLSILELECVLDDVGALDSAAITDNSYISITDPARVAPTLFEPLDMPILRDADDDAGYYAAVAADRLSASDEWPGAVYVQAFSPGAFEQEFTTGDSCVMGESLTILPNWTGGNEFDESSTVNVEVMGELESSTRDLMLADLAVNAMLIGAEVIRFRLATLLSADGERRTYRLSGLLRGQRGTEWAIGGHVANERVILLNNALRRVPGLLTQIGLERDVKAVTLNFLLSDVPDVAFTNDAIGLKPFAPANVVALADGADLRITWQRRTRLSVRYGGPVDQVVPLGEVAEQYRVRIFDGPTLVHTATVTTPEYLYTDLTADGFASGDPVTVEVAQLSAIVGAGYPTITTGIAP